jgi:hypothetical protein
MVVAAAVASPKRFAEMIAAAHDLGFVFYVASRAIVSVTDHIADAKRFCSIEVKKNSMSFHTLMPRNLFEKKSDLSGIYSVSYSLSDFVIQRKVLVERNPSWRESPASGAFGVNSAST